MQTGIFLTGDKIAELSDGAQAEIQKLLFGAPEDEGEEEWDTNVVRLTGPQARIFLETCNEKSRALLELAVKSNGELPHKTVREHFDETAAQLKSVWGGLTKRAKTVTGRKSAKLFQWGQYDDGEWVAYVHPKTVSTLRDALAGD